ncbi:hypothetical protein M8C21_018876, partial [Ambrosia artemisiifolia]
ILSRLGAASLTIVRERAMSVPAVLSQSDQDHNVSSDAPSDVPNRLIVVSNQLPIIAARKTDDNGMSFWDFTWDESSIYMHIKDALPAALEVFYVGALRADVGTTEYNDVSKTLLDRFNCVASVSFLRGLQDPANEKRDLERSIEIKIKASGIHVGQMESYLSQPDTRLKIQELKKRFEGKTVLLGVDDLDIFKGVNFKVLAMEKLLKSHPGSSWLGRAVLVQILNPARGRGQDVVEINDEIRTICVRINTELGSPGYQPIVFIDWPISLSEKAAYYAVSEVAIVTPLRDGMNLIPYEYVVSRQGVDDPNANNPKKSMLVVSEFIGCSPSLTGAIRVNPWDVEDTAEAMFTALTASDLHKETVHLKHYHYITTHDVANWARSFFQDLEQTCIDHSHKRCVNLGFGLDTRVVLFDQKFSKLDTDILENAYSMAQNRAIILDYDGTITPSISKSPTEAVISLINKLCNDPKNMVFIVSGRSKENLGNWFSACEKLAIAAEHGYFIRWASDQEWEMCARENSVRWMEMAEPVMNLYTEATDGSYIEKKETAMVWHYEDADKDFGSDQAKELLDHLENVLANEPVAVKRGQDIVEVKPQGVTKGIVVEKIFAFMSEKGKQADFVLSVGDDKSDEDMFVAIADGITKGQITNNNSVFTCVVGEKPSAAEYYLDETKDVSTMLEKLGHLSNQG